MKGGVFYLSNIFIVLQLISGTLQKCICIHCYSKKTGNESSPVKWK